MHTGSEGFFKIHLKIVEILKLLFFTNSKILSHKFNLSVDSKFSVLNCHFKKNPVSQLTVKFQAVSQLSVKPIQTFSEDHLSQIDDDFLTENYTALCSRKGHEHS